MKISTTVLAAILSVAAACGGDGNGDTTPTIDAPAGPPDSAVVTVDAAPGTPDAGVVTVDAAVELADAATDSPDATPAVDPTVWVYGDLITNNTNVVGRFLQSAAFPPVLSTVAAAGDGDFDVSADGRVLAFTNAGALTRVMPGVAAEILVTAADAGVITSLRVAPDGSAIAFRADSELTDMFDIYVVDGAGTITKVSPDRAANDVGLDAAIAMSWAADSSALVFGGRFTSASKNELWSWTVGAASSVALIDAADIVAPVVAGQPTPGYVLAPLWRGTQVLVQARLRADGKRELYKVNVDGSGLGPVVNAQLTRGDATAAEVWTYGLSPDGTTLVFAADGITAGGFELYKMAADDSAAAVRLTAGTIAAGQEVFRFETLAFAPDGTQVVFHADYGTTADKFEPYVINVADGAVHRLAVIGAAGAAMQVSSRVINWNSDSTIVYVVADHRINDDFELYALTVSETDQVPTLLVDPPASGDVFATVVR